MKITVRCPAEDHEPRPDYGPMLGCGAIFEVDTDNCDDMIDCPECGLFFDPCHPNSQPQTEEACAGWAAHMQRYARPIAP